MTVVERLKNAGFTEAQCKTLVEIFMQKTVVEPSSKYFKRSEFACKCGGKYCNGFPVEPTSKLVSWLDTVRDVAGVPCIISSGVRCEKHNAAVGGVWNSYHKQGRAADFTLVGLSAQNAISIVKSCGVPYSELYAIDGNYVHIAI